MTLFFTNIVKKLVTLLKIKNIAVPISWVLSRFVVHYMSTTQTYIIN